MKPLYELTKDYQQVLALAEEGQDVTDTLDSIQGDIEIKAQGITHIVKSLDNDNLAIDAEIKRLTERKERNTKSAENIKNYLFENMKALGMTEIKTPLLSCKIQKNPPSVVIDNEGAIDAKYLTVIPASFKPDKARIKKDLLEGKDLPYARLEQGMRLVIK
jgi:hypothetical protein